MAIAHVLNTESASKSPSHAAAEPSHFPARIADNTAAALTLEPELQGGPSIGAAASFRSEAYLARGSSSTGLFATLTLRESKSSQLVPALRALRITKSDNLDNAGEDNEQDEDEDDDAMAICSANSSVAETSADDDDDDDMDMVTDSDTSTPSPPRTAAGPEEEDEDGYDAGSESSTPTTTSRSPSGSPMSISPTYPMPPLSFPLAQYEAKQDQASMYDTTSPWPFAPSPQPPQC